MKYHEPVLLKEVLEALQVKEGGKYIDATLGDGGHSLEILKMGGEVLGIDYEEGSLKRASQRIADAGQVCFTTVQGNFKDIENLAKEHGFDQVDGILYDLGYSSSQLGEDLGLSFAQDQPLDMRLDPNMGVSAADLIAGLGEKEIEKILKEFGEETHARKYAKGIVKARKVKKLTTTKELADLIFELAPSRYEKLHPATKVFQALRIAVNNEIDNLKDSLPRAAHLLLPGGRMAIISFHSLEDRVVKQFGSGVQPNLTEEGRIGGVELKMITEKPILPSKEEIEANPRARSAKMRVFERTK